MSFDINHVLAKSDLLSFVERAGGKPKKQTSGYSCACPLHGGLNPTAFSLYRHDGRDMWKCWTDSCGGGDAIDFVMAWQGMDFKATCEFISGDKMDDPVAMKESAEKRLELARIEAFAAKEREDARRAELQTAQRHLIYHDLLNERGWMRDKWIEWGIDEGMQDFWKLGGCDDFFVDRVYHSPTLTIPVYDEKRDLLTIRHRILNPRDPHDKYRPDRTGLHAHPFLALPEMGFDGGLIWVMEGEKKAMVTWTRADIDWQCIGVPGQEMYKHLIEKLRPVAARVIIVPDPNAEGKAYLTAKELGARFLQLPTKIDDYLLTTDANKDDLWKIQKQASIAK